VGGGLNLFYAATHTITPAHPSTRPTPTPTPNQASTCLSPPSSPSWRGGWRTAARRPPHGCPSWGAAWQPSHPKYHRQMHRSWLLGACVCVCVCLCVLGGGLGCFVRVLSLLLSPECRLQQAVAPQRTHLPLPAPLPRLETTLSKVATHDQNADGWRDAYAYLEGLKVRWRGAGLVGRCRRLSISWCLVFGTLLLLLLLLLPPLLLFTNLFIPPRLPHNEPNNNINTIINRAAALVPR